MAERLARGAPARGEALDAQIAEAATHWRIERIAPVDRTILRLGAYELAEEKRDAGGRGARRGGRAREALRRGGLARVRERRAGRDPQARARRAAGERWA